jgi:putative ABC transport system permease protein
MSFLSSWLRVALIDLKLDVRRFAVLLACLALGVGTIAAVGSVGAALSDAVGRQSRAFLGGDLEASIGYRPANAEERALFAGFGKLTEVIEITSRATEGERSALISVRGVDGAYPLVGVVSTDPPQPLGDLLAARNGVFGMVGDQLLYDRLGARTGDTIRIGNEDFELRGKLLALPDQAARGFSIGASVLVPSASLAEAGILAPGVLARYRYKIDLAGGDYATDAAAIKARFPDAGWQVRSPREASASLTRFLDIFDRFLILVGLSSLLVGGIGVSNATAAYITERERSIAILRSLGATGRRIMVHFLLQVMLLGAIGTAAGLALGAVSTLILLPILAGYLTLDLPAAVYPLPLGIGAAFGLLIALIFAWPALLRAANLRPAALFRAVGGIIGQPGSWRDLLGWRAALPLLLGVAAIAGLAVATTRQPMLVLWYGLGTAGAFLLLRLASLVLQLVIRRLPPARLLVLRLALRNIFRPGAPTPVVIVSLGLGLVLILSIALVEASVRGQLSGQLSSDAPSFVLMNVSKTTVPTLTGFARDEPRIASLSFTPFLRGIVTRLNGKKIADLGDLDEAAQRRLGGDQALSWRADLPPGDTILDGKWWDEGYTGPPLVSLDEDFARPLHLKAGDTLEIAISGRPIMATVANIRHVFWQNASISFEILFSPGLIESAPATYMGALKTAPGAEAAIEALLVRDFPTLGFIPVSDVLAQIANVIGALANAVTMVGAVALLSGVFVLAGALAAGRRQREADAIVAKVLGATRRQIATAYLIEYGLLGLLATAIAAVLGAVAGWLVVTRVLQLSFSLDPPLIVIVAAAATAVTVLTGLATTWSALTSRPATFLRAEE